MGGGAGGGRLHCEIGLDFRKKALLPDITCLVCNVHTLQYLLLKCSSGQGKGGALKLIPKETSAWPGRGCEVDCPKRHVASMTQNLNLRELAGVAKPTLQLFPVADAFSLLSPTV